MFPASSRHAGTDVAGGAIATPAPRVVGRLQEPCGTSTRMNLMRLLLFVSGFLCLVCALLLKVLQLNVIMIAIRLTS
jgi:hypothetical protein